MLRVKRRGFQSKCHRTVQFRLNVACEPSNDMLTQSSRKEVGVSLLWSCTLASEGAEDMGKLAA